MTLKDRAKEYAHDIPTDYPEEQRELLEKLLYDCYMEGAKDILGLITELTIEVEL